MQRKMTFRLSTWDLTHCSYALILLLGRVPACELESNTDLLVVNQRRVARPSSTGGAAGAGCPFMRCHPASPLVNSRVPLARPVRLQRSSADESEPGQLPCFSRLLEQSDDLFIPTLAEQVAPEGQPCGFAERYFPAAISTPSVTSR